MFMKNYCYPQRAKEAQQQTPNHSKTLNALDLFHNNCFPKQQLLSTTTSGSAKSKKILASFLCAKKTYLTSYEPLPLSLCFGSQKLS